MAKSNKISLRTVVTFTSVAFKTVDEEDKPQFRGTFGDDAALWLMLELETDGVDVVPGLHQADVGWCFRFRMNGRQYLLSVCLSDPLGPVWQAIVERDIEGMGAWFGGRRRGVRPEAVAAVHSVLAGSEKVASLWWYVEQDLKAGREGKGSSDPMSLPG
jgi:hypothetical protein